MKKALHYFQKQALQYSDEKYQGAAYLSPRINHEPQQRLKHHSHAQDTKHLPISSPQVVPSNCRKSSGRQSHIPSRISSNIQRFQYASENILQSYEVYIPPEVEAAAQAPPPYSASSTSPSTQTNIPKPSTQKYWIVYLHGGYFRDPSTLASSFHRSLSLLTSTSSPSTPKALQTTSQHISGFVSINYRLAPHEAHPQPPSTPSYELRNAFWPDFLDDVLLALKHWQGKYPEVRERWVLVGHSVGATLALNALLGMREKGLVMPKGIVGVSGIYDFLRLHERHPEYRGMTRNAIGEERWEGVSVARKGKKEFEEAWRGVERVNADEENEGRRKRWMILAHSKEDGLVPWSQVEELAGVFEDEQQEQQHDEGDGGGEGVEIMSRVIEIKGKHNACWEDGHELARVICEAVGEIL